ncbi:Zinc knuckle domain protein [Pyrenophora tritici-repentis]|uniref:Putative zinc knuckle protein n=1 Tax=Pyrenophora tritici-repentis TaxID=45151 RepID=A0A2W1GAX2_9PLEO|nr:Zinc knuckle domain protein [Pyrenophora tritici-repentis]KAF7568545.1 putative zinc knuckle protein [Pyrenophora tritici-repentis]PZD33536.1 zinc knuckle protein [Pyrenophora tritici-repentis]
MPSANTPKTMSKGLMGMKFMQRAAAKSSPSSPATPNGPPTKKARLSSGAGVGTSDQEIIQSAVDAEEEKRQAALDKAAEHAGETKWVLSFKDPLEGKRQDAMEVRQAGFAEIDAEDESEEEEIKPVRMQFGGGVKKPEIQVPFVKTEGSESGSESSSDDYDSDDPTADLIRQTKREMAAEKREKKKHAGSSNETPNGLSSISGGRRSGGLSRPPPNMDNVDCFNCGRKGHMAAGCPKSSTPRGSAGRGRGKGRR